MSAERAESEESKKYFMASTDVAEKMHAYVSTDSWREGILRTYKFLDDHKLVKDVVVQPIVTSEHREEFDTINRVKVCSPSEAQEVFAAYGARMPKMKTKSIMIVPIILPDAQRVADITAFLPSPWMIYHASFDSSLAGMPRTLEVMTYVEKLLATMGVDESCYEELQAGALLLNCGWSKNAAHIVSAAHQMSKQSGESVIHHLSHTRAPVVGKIYRSPEDVPQAKEGAQTGASYTLVNMGDIVGEMMTIAMTKRYGLKPAIERIHLLPDEAFKTIITTQTRFFDQTDIDSAQSGRISPDLRKRAEQRLISRMMNVSGNMGGIREAFVADLLGKVLFIAAIP